MRVMTSAKSRAWSADPEIDIYMPATLVKRTQIPGGPQLVWLARACVRAVLQLISGRPPEGGRNISTNCSQELAVVATCARAEVCNSSFTSTHSFRRRPRLFFAVLTNLPRKIPACLWQASKGRLSHGVTQCRPSYLSSTGAAIRPNEIPEGLPFIRHGVVPDSHC